jgi:hypothetical protein
MAAKEPVIFNSVFISRDWAAANNHRRNGRGFDHLVELPQSSKNASPR